MMLYYVILLIMTLFGAVAGFCLKKASSTEGIQQLIRCPFLFVGGSLYFISALMNIYVLKYLDYSTVLPLTAVTYIWTMLLSGAVLKEKITIRKVVGTVAIVVGALFVAI